MSAPELYEFWTLALRVGLDSFMVRRLLERIEFDEMTSSEATDLLEESCANEARRADSAQLSRVTECR